MKAKGMEATLHGKIEVEYIDGNQWELQPTDVPFMCIVDDKYVIQPVPGFVTDFLSIPWYAQWLLPKAGYPDGSGKAAVIHDWLYSYPGIDHTPPDRRWADDVFLSCLEFLQVPYWKRQLMYAAVRIGGGPVYGNENKLNKLRGIFKRGL